MAKSDCIMPSALPMEMKPSLVLLLYFLMLHSGQPSIQILICSYNGCGGKKKKRKKAGKPISPTSCTAIPSNDGWLISEQNPKTYRNRPVWLGHQINKPVTHSLDGWQRFCRHSNSPIQLALLIRVVSLCPNPKLLRRRSWALSLSHL